MAKPLVAIVGRPNVGKSTLFNRLSGHRIAIVDDTPGVTRDRLYADAEWLQHSFTIIDTGGIEPYAEDVILQQMKRQAEIAIETADIILFIVDGKEGVTSSDEDVAAMLRKSQKPVLLVVNKVDHVSQNDRMLDFYALGMDVTMGISAIQGLGIGDMLEEIVRHFPAPSEEEADESIIKIAVVGRPNVGKSSLVNALLSEDRHIVSNIPGTTRDAVDSPIMVDDQNYILIDTAGIRRKSKVEDATLERYSVIRALAAVRRCDVALIVIDAQQGITEQDVKIAGYVHEEGKACAIIVNKWDAVDKDNHTMSEFKRMLNADLAFMDYAPSLFISAKQGQRVRQVLPLAQMIFHHAGMRITTGTLNDVLGDATAITPPPLASGKRLRIYYGTQVSAHPPTFVLFVNNPERMHYSYLRYLENHFRKTFTFEGTPIRFILRARDKAED